VSGSRRSFEGSLYHRKAENFPNNGTPSHTRRPASLKAVSISVSTIVRNACSLKKGQIACPEISVRNYNRTLHIIPDEHIYHLLRGESLKWCKYEYITLCLHTNFFLKKKSSLQCSVIYMKHISVKYNYIDILTTRWLSSVQSSPDQFSSVQSRPVQFSPVQTSSVQFSPVQTSSVQFSSVQSRPVQFSPVQTSLVQSSPFHSSSVKSIQSSPYSIFVVLIRRFVARFKARVSACSVTSLLHKFLLNPLLCFPIYILLALNTALIYNLRLICTYYYCSTC